MELREYQKNICKKLARAIDTNKHKILLSAPTGAGKTVIFTDFSKRISTLGKNTLIVVDRIELLGQTIRHGTKETPFGYLTSNKFKDEKIVVSMLQTLRARLKKEEYQEWLNKFDVIFLDEVHQYFCGSSFKAISDFANDNCSIVGCSATPWDNKGYLLGGFDEFINEVDIRDLIEQGYLVKPEHFTVDLFDFSNVKVTSTGDYDTGAIDDIIIDTTKMDKVLDGWLKFSQRKKTIAFCSTVASAEKYAEFFRLNGIKAACVSAQNSDTERTNILKDFKEGNIEILMNVGLLVAGFDEPSIECVVFLNPTKVLRKYIQCAGRGLRLCPEINKEKCIFLDFCGNSFRHLEVDAIRSYIPAPPKREVEDFDEIECPACGTVFPISENQCPECGFILELNEESEGRIEKPKNKKDFERLIKLKSIQQELHDTIFEFANLPCLVKLEETGNVLSSGRMERKWCYGYREDGTPIFKGQEGASQFPLITNAKKTNCWYVFHTICTKFEPSMGALRYYGSKLRKAKKFLEQIKNPNNKVFVNLYNLM